MNYIIILTFVSFLLLAGDSTIPTNHTKWTKTQLKKQSILKANSGESILRYHNGKQLPKK